MARSILIFALSAVRISGRVRSLFLVELLLNPEIFASFCSGVGIAYYTVSGETSKENEISGNIFPIANINSCLIIITKVLVKKEHIKSRHAASGVTGRYLPETAF
jgi:hypothetical protein